MRKTKKEVNSLCLKVKETSSKEKVSKSDLELLKLGLQNANSPCQLAEILQDTNCEPCEFNVNNLPSRQRITNAEEVVGKLNETAVWLGILENLCNDLDTAIIRADGKSKMFVQQSYQSVVRCIRTYKKTHESKTSAKSGFNKESAG